MQPDYPFGRLAQWRLGPEACWVPRPRGGSGPAPTPPVNTGAPAVSGTFDWGSTLTATPGTWTGADTVAGQWQRLDPAGPTWSDITGETALTYVIDDELDYPGGLRYRETATNGAGSVSVNSAASSSPWATLIAEVPSLRVLRRSARQTLGGAGTLAEWGAHNAALAAESPVTSTAPLLVSGEADYDGVDDRMTLDALASTGEGEHTFILVLPTLTLSGTAARNVLVTASTASGLNTEQVRLRLGGGTASSRWQYYMRGSTALTLNISSLRATYGAGPYCLAARCTGAGGTAAVIDLTPSTPAVVASGTAPATLPASQDYLTLGLSRYGAGPTETGPYLGTMALVLIAPVALTDTQLATARAILVAEGYL